MNASVLPTQFTEGESLELNEYRPVNRFAVLSAILGGLSVLALISTLLLALPFVGAAAGLIAYWQLTRPGSLQSGKGVAKWGIFLSLVFAIWVSSAAGSRQSLLMKQARVNAGQWFELIREGKLQEAHQLTIPQLRRVRTQDALAEYYLPKDRTTPSGTDHSPADTAEMFEPSGAELYKRLFTRPIMERLVALGKNASYEYVRTTSLTQVRAAELLIVQQFRVTPNQGEPFYIELTLERIEEEHVANWRIDENVREI